MVSKYTTDMAMVIHMMPCPHKGFIVDVEEKPDQLLLIIYHDNIVEFNTQQQQDLAFYIIAMLQELRKLGVWGVEVRERAPRASYS